MMMPDAVESGMRPPMSGSSSRPDRVAETPVEICR
jgi:hypothetical protein